MPNPLLTNSQLRTTIEEEHRNLGIDSETPQTFVNALTSAFKDALERVNDQIRSYYNRSILELATNQDLDERAVEFGITREEEVNARDDTLTNFNVFITNGVASDFALDQNAPIVIPSRNITVYDTERNQYIVGGNITIEPDAFSGYAPIISVTTTATNVPVNDINQISVIRDDNITNLDPTKASQIEFGCTNNKAIVSPGVATDDADMRSKSFLRINAMNNTNQDAIRLALLNIGIEDINFISDYFGFGSLGVLVRINGNSNLSTTSIELLNNVITNIVPNVRLILPEPLVTKFVFNVDYEDGSLVDQTKLDILDVVTAFFGNIDIGESFDPISLREQVLNITNVRKFDIRCIYIDDRKVVMRKQFALIDQIFTLDEDAPIEYTA